MLCIFKQCWQVIFSKDAPSPCIQCYDRINLSYCISVLYVQTSPINFCLTAVKTYRGIELVNQHEKGTAFPPDFSVATSMNDREN